MNCILSASCLLPSIFFLYILFLCSCRVDCYDTLKQGEWITDNGKTLVSSGGTFELGFFNASHKRYVGIWYHEWDQQTFVWVANRDDPVVNGSTGVSFGIAEDGNLQAWDNTTGKVYWKTTNVEISSKTNRNLKLMDSGNLVLSDDDDQLATSLWESFQNPTNTFLPGMKMDENLTLTSWIGDGDPGKGQYTFKQDQQGEGYYVISKKPKPLAYWRSSRSEMPFIIAQLLSNFSFSSSDSFNASPTPCERAPRYYSCLAERVSYKRLVMNYTGELQYYSNWSLTWREPEDECSIYNACGNFGSCNINNRPFLCKCLPGFQPTNPGNWNSSDFLDGCTRNWASTDKSDMFLNLKMMKVSNPDSDMNVKDETECRKACLENSPCRAYSHEVAQRTDKCRIWTSELSNLEEEYTNGGSNLSVRVAKSVIEPTVRNCEPCGTNLIPYPLSTGPDCGHPMYFSFYCNTSTGQVSFKASSDTYRVASINPSTRKFVIQEKNSTRTLQVNKSSPFNATRWFTVDSGKYSSEVKYELEISWELPPEPNCTSSRDCKDWPNSTCNTTSDGKRRCLCTGNFRWDGSNNNCTTTKGGDFPLPSEDASKEKMSLALIVMIPLIVVFFLASAIVGIYMWRRKMAKTQERRRSDERNQVLRRSDSERHLKDLIGSSEFKEEDEKGIDVPFFDLESILVATDNFSDANKLGQGGYGPVYKGTFPGSQEIAVKRLSTVSGQGLEEFKNEVVLISKLQHRNLVRLRGYCIKRHEKILLYEYMPNKSLDSFIFDQKLSMCLDWEMRFKIILGIARGLVYLHHDSRLRIIHRDLKTSNILLDEKMNPKISDFGLAKIVGGEETGANTTRLVGTYGYMSPEYAQNGIFSIKSDVFSFGVVLLEIISGKKNTGFYQSELAMSLLDYAWRLWVKNKVLDLMDQTLHEVCNANQYVRCVNIGLLCVQDNSNDRPTMSNVVTMLDSEATIVPTPKRPAFVPGAGPSSTTSSSSRPDTYSESTTSLGGK